MKDIQQIKTYTDFLGELTATYKRTKIKSTKIGSSMHIEKFIRPYFDECMDDHEEVKIIHLNNNNQIVNVDHHSKGGITGATFDIKLILRHALLTSMTSIIAVHNHPSGKLQFSQNDISLSINLKKACGIIGINFLDSLIITREDYKSMADEGLL